MKFENYMTAIADLPLLSLGKKGDVKHKCNQPVTYHTIDVQGSYGDVVDKVYSYGEPPRELQPRLGTSEARIVLTKFIGYDGVSDHYIQISHSNTNTISYEHNQRGNNTMNNLIKRVVLTFIALTMLGFAFVNFGGIPAIGITPIAGISLFRRTGKEDTSNTDLPQPYNGMRTNTPREQYIAEQVKQVDQNEVYRDKVSQVTSEAKEQWDKDNPVFSEIQRLITDNNYCDLVEAYLKDGLQSPEAIDNTLIAIINDEGTKQSDGVISLNDTFGNFVDNVLDVHCLDCHVERTELINKVITFKDQYGVTFKHFNPDDVSPSSPSRSAFTSSEDGEQTDSGCGDSYCPLCY